MFVKKRNNQWINYVLGLLIIGFIIISIVLGSRIRLNMETSLDDGLGATIYNVQVQVDDFFATNIKKAGNDRAHPDFVAHIENMTYSNDNSLSEVVVKELDRLHGRNEEIQLLWVYIAEGDYFVVGNDAEDLLDDRDYTSRRLAQERGPITENVHISEVYTDLATGRRMIDMYIYIMGDEGPIGQIGINLFLDILLEEIGVYELSHEFGILIIDHEGKYVYSDDLWTDSWSEYTEEGLIEVARDLSEDLEGTAKVQHDGEDYYLAYRPLATLDWDIIIYSPASALDSDMTVINMLSILSTGISVLVLIVYLSYMRTYSQKNNLQNMNDKLIDHEAIILEMANMDPLTEMPNRRKFTEYVSYSLEQGSQGNIILMDLDNFKEINDIKGHIFGDEVLKEVAKRLLTLVELGVSVSRFGGDEFLLLIDNTASEMTLNQAMDRLRELFRKAIVLEGEVVYLNFSAGVSCYPKDSSDIHELIMYADTAMYCMKGAGKAGYKMFTKEMAMALSDRIELVNLLKKALDSDLFYLVYQPQIDPRTNRILSMEALLRINGESISPAQFIPIAEQTGMIIPIGRKVIEIAVCQLASWQAEGYQLQPVAVNFSIKQLNDLDFVKYVVKTLNKYKIPPEYLHIEITESVFMEDESRAVEALKQLKEKGITIAMDDFGTGYSSLSCLRDLPVDILKLDKSISDHYIDVDESSFIRDIIHLAHGLNLIVIAEGIEEESQVHDLVNAKCDLIQGYYYAKPMRQDKLSIDYLKRQENDISKPIVEPK